MKLLKKLLLFSCMSFVISGCNKENPTSTEPKSDSNTQIEHQNTTQNTITTEEEYINCIDIKEIADSITINGQPMDFPIDTTKLKQSISLSIVNQSVSFPYYNAILLEDHTSLATAYLYSESGNIEEDASIHFLEVKDGSNWKLSVKGITFGSSVADVIATIGEPLYKNGEETGTYRIYYENCEYEFLAFAFENGTLKTISIEYLPEEWRK